MAAAAAAAPSLALAQGAPSTPSDVAQDASGRPPQSPNAPLPADNTIGTPKTVPNSNRNPNPDPSTATGNNNASSFGFDYGSYGRVGVGSDLRGHEGYGSDVVSHGTRYELAPYVELAFYYTGKVDDSPYRKWRIVLVPAFAGGDLFHYTGSLDSHFVLRNAYAEVENVGLDGLTLWVGSRTYRGDDMYQFNYWPLDNLNTVGAGALFTRKRTTAALHVGLNRLDSAYQYETLDTPPRGLGPPTSSTVLDRPRAVVSFKLTQGFWREGSTRGAKVAVYGELHALPSGETTDATTRLVTPLPRDFGWVAGAQLSGWLKPNVFLNLWFRSAGGLAAYGELTAPTALPVSHKVTGALELVGALSGNWETKYVGLMVAAYARRFVDAGAGEFNPMSYTEGIVAVRPTVYLGKYFHLAAEVSFQGRSSDGLDPYFGRVLRPKVFRASFAPTVSPTGKGSFARPNLYLVYQVSRINQDGLDALFNAGDYRALHDVVHYAGGGVEWWFNSSYR